MSDTAADVAGPGTGPNGSAAITPAETVMPPEKNAHDPAEIAVPALVPPRAAPDPAIPPAVVPSGLPLPAWIALVRVARGAITPIPATEQTLWIGAMRQVSHGLLYPVRVRPLILQAGDSPDVAWPGATEPEVMPDLPAYLEAAARAGFDAVLVHALDARAESDRMLALFSDIPFLGGMVGPTVTTEVHGQAWALLIGTRTGAVLGQSAARMVNRPVAPVHATAGRANATLPVAEYALLELLLPGVEDMMTNVIAAGF